MNKISELKSILGENLPWNKARLDCFVKMLLALFVVRTVNLSEIAVAFSSKAELSSRYKRLQRFFAQFKIDYTIFARLIFKLFFSNTQKIYLTIDRTNWYWGKQKINIFMLGVAYEGISIPLFWSCLPKAGSSNIKEQKALINRFLKCFGSSQIIGLLGDREYGSGGLFNWLNKNNIPFYIRIKEGSMVHIKKKKLFTVKKIFRELNPKEHRVFDMAVELFGQRVFIAGSRSEKGELMIVATNRLPKNAISIYLRRWEIECLFHALKGRGFRFEETHMTTLERVEKLMALLALGMCWAHKIGEWKARKKSIKINRHRESNRPQNSFFRYGLDFIRDLLINPCNKISQFRVCISELFSFNAQQGPVS
ncbi:transposase [Legionella nautarum]|uniref:Transposase n=1 Tax=Legionella nautarum TaxID=45070 RepID=A0A0W0WKS3_9GAMM|nr:IS4 family transposase [Legionella nautarum]KTD32923.1 transposase [Legionella nautarum]